MPPLAWRWASSARPLLRRLHELAGRALITLPPDVDRMLARPVTAPAGPRAQVAPTPVADMSTSPTAYGMARSAAGADTFGLSKRELEVLGLISQGRTNREIGDRLFISQKTVGVHVGNILAKLGVSGRVEAAAVAIRLGLETPGDRGPGRSLTPRHRAADGSPRRHWVDSTDSSCPPRTEVFMRRLLLALVFAVAAGLLSACTSATAPGWTYAPPTEPPASQAAPSGDASAAPATPVNPTAVPSSGSGGTVLQVSALNIAYEQSDLTAPANVPFVIHFDNRDSGIPHNVEIKDPSGQSVFKGTIITGPKQADYNVGALPRRAVHVRLLGASEHDRHAQGRWLTTVAER